MEAFAQFLHMGGYGAYVWSAYAFAGVVLALNILLAQRAESDGLRHLRHCETSIHIRRGAEARVAGLGGSHGYSAPASQCYDVAIHRGRAGYDAKCH